MILLHNVEPFTSADSRQVFVSVFFTVGGGDDLIFGSGTKLLVTDEQVVKPVVSVYPAASRAHLEGKSSLLCLASAMFPPLVKFSWKRQKEDGDPEEVHRDVGDPEKLKESGCTASILLIHQHESSTYKYRCSVQHEGGTVEAQTEQELPAPPTSTQPTSTPPPSSSTPPPSPSTTPPSPSTPSTSTPPPSAPPPAASPPSQYKVKLLCLLYTVLIVKSLVYCCGLSLLMILRNKGPSTSCTHAD